MIITIVFYEFFFANHKTNIETFELEFLKNIHISLRDNCTKVKIIHIKPNPQKKLVGLQRRDLAKAIPKEEKAIQIEVAPYDIIILQHFFKVEVLAARIKKPFPLCLTQYL